MTVFRIVAFIALLNVSMLYADNATEPRDGETKPATSSQDITEDPSEVYPEPQPPSSSSEVHQEPQSPSPSLDDHLAAVIGGVVGGVLLVIAVAVMVIVIRRRMRRAAEAATEAAAAKAEHDKELDKAVAYLEAMASLDSVLYNRNIDRVQLYPDFIF